MMSWLQVLLVCGTLSVHRGDDKMDYLQPYKFVKPLEDLGDLYGASATKAEAPIAEARSGEAAPSDAEPALMTASLEPPGPVPVAEKLINPTIRSRKRLLVNETVTEEDKISNHKNEAVEEDADDDVKEEIKENDEADKEEKDEEATAESRTEPESRAIRGRVPPRPDDEYYYYYEDEYYYDDYAEYNASPVKTNEKYPNFPEKPHVNKPKEYPPKNLKPKDFTKPKERPLKEGKPRDYPPKQGNPKNNPPKELKPSDNIPKENKPKDNTPRENRPKNVQPEPTKPQDKPVKDSKNKSTRPKSSKPKEDTRRYEHSDRIHQDERKGGYSIQSTLTRLKGLKETQLQRQGRPSLPNPWEKFNLPPQSKPDTRVKGVEKGSPPKPDKSAKPLKPASPVKPVNPVKPSKLVKPVKPVAEYYSEDYYYDYAPALPFKPFLPVQPNRRQGVLSFVNPLALLVAPLAGIALLTAAAAVAINPVLVTVSLTGKRRRRNAEEDMDEGISPELEEKIHEMQVLEKFMASVPENLNYQHQVLSMYLSCSGYTEVGNSCMDRVVCEYADSKSSISTEERDVISIVLFNIMSNEFVTPEYKDRLRLAAKQGRDEGKCLVYECTELADMSNNNL